MGRTDDSLTHLAALREAISSGEDIDVLLLRVDLLESSIPREASRAYSEGIWQGRGETPGEVRIRERDESMAAINEASIQHAINVASRKTE